MNTHSWSDNLAALFLTLLVSTIFSSSSLYAGEGQAPFKRIISLYPAHTENLAALGLVEELIGIAASDTYPPAILTKPKFSLHDNPEKFIAARPDLVLIRPMIAHAAPQLLAQLKGAGIAVISLQPRTIDEMFDYWRELGRISGREEEASRMISLFEEELARIQGSTASVPFSKRPKVYFESIHAKMKTFSPSSIAVFALLQAGGRNIATDAQARRGSNIAAYGKEQILAHAAEIDIFLAQEGRMNRISKEEIAVEPGFQAIKAVREGKIFLVDEQLVSRPTPRILEGIREIQKILYPTHKTDTQPALNH
ncbi:MAG: ABC transporter substrate-binding protein [Proteobacteria bacterium]|nr:ABC transporter substrate-binding protein [Pseudomonadota bacterium]MBU1058390.1 ABC transporter substrate-binding protein [Pseudomonadota bacterium]